MATSFKYRFGKSLGKILLLVYVFAAIIGVAGSGYGVQSLSGFSGWKLWAGVVPIGLLVLWFIPRPVDVLLLAPLAFWGLTTVWEQTYLTSALIVGIPVLIVVFLSLGRK